MMEQVPTRVQDDRGTKGREGCCSSFSALLKMLPQATSMKTERGTKQMKRDQFPARTPKTQVYRAALPGRQAAGSHWVPMSGCSQHLAPVPGGPIALPRHPSWAALNAPWMLLASIKTTQITAPCKTPSKSLKQPKIKSRDLAWS